MPVPRDRPDDRPNIGTAPFIEGLQALEGEEMPADQDAVLDPDEIEGRRQPTQTEVDRGEASEPVDVTDDEAVSVEGLGATGLREDETGDPDVAAEEGIPWVPPIDPPVVPSEDGDDPVVAAGTGVDAIDDYDEAGVLLSEEGELTERIREALRADSATSRLADSLIIGTIGSTAVIRGQVDDIDDGDAVAAVVERVAGVDEVRDETEVAGL
jgi:hypothetical protein